MQTALFDDNAPKEAVGFVLNRDLYAKVRAAGIDASRVAEEALVRALWASQREGLLKDIQRDTEAVARYVAQHGDPTAELYELDEPPDAA